LSLLPLSIPSPPIDWQIPWSIPLGWLHGLIPAIAETQVIQIHTYALCILLGIILATIMVNQRLKARGAEPGIVLDVIIWAIPLGLVGARLYHVFTHPGDYFFEGADPWNITHPGNVRAIWEGGNALFGSLIGGAIGAWIGCRINGLRLWSFADALAPAMLLAQALGRFGNYFNHELFGQPTNLPWGLEIESDNAAFPVGLAEGTLFHPTFLYEMIWNVVGIVFLLALERRFQLVRRTILGISVPVPVGEKIARLQWGKVWALYMIWYGVGRAWFESIRVDPSEVFFGIRTNVWGAFAAILLGIILFAVQSRRHPGLEPSPYLPGREWTPEGAVDSSETYSNADEPDDDVTVSTDKPASEKLATSGAGTKSS
jgi:prolipoprotein diacylglyceryl transferase